MCRGVDWEGDNGANTACHGSIAHGIQDRVLINVLLHGSLEGANVHRFTARDIAGSTGDEHKATVSGDERKATFSLSFSQDKR